MANNEALEQALKAAEAEAATAVALNADAVAGVERIIQTITATAGRNKPQSLKKALAQLEGAKKQFVTAGQQAADAQKDIKTYLATMAQA